MITSPANAYDSYGDCVGATYDPIGCGLIELFGTTSINNSNDLKPSEKDQSRVKKMLEQGAFKKFENGKPRESNLKGATLVRHCKISDLLNRYEKGAKLEKLSEACYKQIK